MFNKHEPRNKENKQPIKKPKLEQNYSDSSFNDSDISLHDSSEDLSDEFKNIEELNEEKLSEGDFVLVRFGVRNTIIHFVGQILGIKDNNTRIKFLRRKGLSTTFYFPDIDDIIEVNNKDIISKIIASSNTGTARTAAYFHFCYNFATLTVN